MFIRLSGRAAPAFLLVFSSLWMLGTILPLCYSLLFPNPEIKHIVRAFEGREDLEGHLAPLASVTNSVGRLKRAIQVTAYWGVSAGTREGSRTQRKQRRSPTWRGLKSARSPRFLSLRELRSTTPQHVSTQTKAAFFARFVSTWCLLLP